VSTCHSIRTDRDHSLNRFVFLAALILFAASAPSGAEIEPETGTLIVTVANLQSDEGDLRFVMFDSRKSFLKNPVRADIVEISGRQGTWIVENLPYGTYAVLVHHDINGSGKMERHWYGKPKEPTGVSNDAPSKFGPPKFKHAKFVFAEPSLKMTITVQ